MAATLLVFMVAFASVATIGGITPNDTHVQSRITERALSIDTHNVTAIVPTHERQLQTYTQSDNFQSLMLAAVNVERAKVGAAPLCTNAKLQVAAQSHSNDMATNNFMSHTGSNGSTMVDRINAQGYSWWTLGENVAAGQVDVTAVMTAWMNSPGHKANLLNANFKQFGMGYAYNAASTYKHYWTQDFGASSSETCVSVTTPTPTPSITAPAKTTPTPTTTAPAKTTPTPTTTAPAKTTPTPTTTAPAKTTPTPTTATPTPTSTDTTIQARMLTAVNAERAKVGAAPLCTNAKLQVAAQSHSNDMATNNFMSHTGSNGSTMVDRINAQGYSWWTLGENVAAGQVDVTAVMTAWMNSPGHKANLLNANFKQFGMGYAYNAASTYKHYWTQDFGASSPEACA